MAFRNFCSGIVAVSATLLMVVCAECKAGYFRKKLKHNVAKLRKENEGIYHAGEVTLSEVCRTDSLDLSMLLVSL